jgi:hypothetical protein
MGGVATDPGGGKAEKADQIVDAVLEPLDLGGRVVELDRHAKPVAWELPSGVASVLIGISGTGPAQYASIV